MDKLFTTNYNETSIYFINDHKDKLLRVSNHWGGGTFLPTKDFKKQDFINDLKTIKFMINLKKLN